MPDLHLGPPAWIVAAGLVASLLLTRLVRDAARRRALVDLPNERSSHRLPVPRVGGLGILVPFLAGGAALAAWAGAPARTFAVLAAVGCVSALGLADDLRPLPARLRFLVQAAAALAVVLLAGGAAPGSPWLQALPAPLRVLLLVLWIVWTTNLYNFMDGIDGLAGGQAALAGCALALAAFAGGAVATGWLCLLLAAGALGFLAFNSPPASIFMGDVGSTAIGFFFACAPLLPEARPLPLEAVALALSLFILDATTTLLRRIARGERWLEAHRTHLYQRPVVLGLPHAAVARTAWCGMALVGLLAARWPAAGAWERALSLCVPPALFLAARWAVARLEAARR